MDLYKINAQQLPQFITQYINEIYQFLFYFKGMYCFEVSPGNKIVTTVVHGAHIKIF